MAIESNAVAVHLLIKTKKNQLMATQNQITTIQNSELKAQTLFREKGYQTSDNRSIEWRSINKALDYGISIILVGVGKYRTNNNGFNWNICLQYANAENKFFQRYYNAKIGSFVCGNWVSSSSDVVSYQVLSCVLDFREALIGKDILKVVVNFETEPTMKKCSKCNGKGVIMAFKHVAKGVCFDCMGLGYGNQGKVSIL